MVKHANKKADGAPDNTDKRAPLSSYLQYDRQEDAGDAWTVFSSEENEPQPHAPNLSVLKQIKNFLNNKPGDDVEPAEPSARQFHVDYPFYDAEPETEPSVPNAVEPEPVYAQFRQEEPEPIEPDAEEEDAFNAECSLSPDAVVPLEKESVEASCAEPAPEPEPEPELELESQPEPEAEPEPEPTPEPLPEEPAIVAEEDVVLENVPSAIPEEAPIVDEEPIVVEEEADDAQPVLTVDVRETGAENAAISETVEPASWLLDADDLIGASVQDLAHANELETVCEIDETIDDVPEEPLEPKHKKLDLAFHPAPEAPQTEPEPALTVVEAPRQEVPSRRATKSRMPIFRRFVDLVTNREEEPKRSAPKKQVVKDAPRDERIVRPEPTAAAEASPSVTVELVLAPYYTGADLNNPLESYVIGGGENVVY